MSDRRPTSDPTAIDATGQHRQPPLMAGPVTTNSARQGTPGRRVLYILIAALLLGAIYVIGMQIWAATEPTPPAGMIENGEAAPKSDRLRPVLLRTGVVV